MPSSPSPSSTTTARNDNAASFVFPSDQSAGNTSFPDFSLSLGDGTAVPDDAESCEISVSKDPHEPESRSHVARRTPKTGREGSKRDTGILSGPKDAGIDKRRRGRSLHRRTSSMRDLSPGLLQALSGSKGELQHSNADHRSQRSPSEKRRDTASQLGRNEDSDHIMRDVEVPVGPEEMTSGFKGLAIDEKEQ